MPLVSGPIANTEYSPSLHQDATNLLGYFYNTGKTAFLCKDLMMKVGLHAFHVNAGKQPLPLCGS